MLGQRSHRREGGSALGALDLQATGRVHALVATKVRELGVRFEADFAAERLDAGVDVGVLLESRTRGERLPTLGTRVAASTDVLGADVALEVGWISEDLATGLACVSA